MAVSVYIKDFISEIIDEQSQKSIVKNNIWNNSIFCFPCDLWTRGILKYTDRSVIYSAQAGCNPRKNRNISCLGDEYAERLLFVPIFYAPLVFARCRSLPLPRTSNIFQHGIKRNDARAQFRRMLHVTSLSFFRNKKRFRYPTNRLFSILKEFKVEDVYIRF